MGPLGPQGPHQRPPEPPRGPGTFLDFSGFWPPGGLPARGKISHRKVSSKGSQATRDPSRDLRLEKLVPQKIPSPDLPIKKNSKSKIFFRNPAVWSSAGGGIPAGLAGGREVGGGGGRRRPGGGPKLLFEVLVVCLRRFFPGKKRVFREKSDMYLEKKSAPGRLSRPQDPSRSTRAAILAPVGHMGPQGPRDALSP